MTAADYVKLYHGINVPKFTQQESQWVLFGGGFIATPVTEYSNALHTMYSGKSFSDRWDFYEDLINFCKARGKEKDSGVKWSNGPNIVCSWLPMHGFTRKNMQDSIEGKAAPAVLTQMIQVVSYWVSYQSLIEGETMSTVPQYVSDYLGVDCNGFVGNYLKAKYPGVKCKHSTPEEQYLVWGKYGGVIRKSPADLAADDVIVFDGHIAVINKVILATEKEALVEVSESRTRKMKKGGPQTNTWWIRHKAGVFELVDRDTAVKGICRIGGMD